MKIQILCQECPQCDVLEKNVILAAKAIGIDVELESRKGPSAVTGRPKLVIDGEVRSIGRVLSPEELMKLLKFILHADA